MDFNLTIGVYYFSGVSALKG